MVKSFQFNNRKETEKTEDVINTLVSSTPPLTSTYDDTANTLTLTVETGGGDGDLLKVGDADITTDQFIKMKANGVVGGVNTGKDANELLKVGGADISTGQLLGMNNDGGVVGVNTGKDANELLKVGSIEINGNTVSEITSGQLLIMNGEDVIGKTIGNLQSNILQNGADLTDGHILKMSSSQVIGEALGVAQDNILVSGGNITNDEYLYNADGVIKGRTIDASVVSLLKAGDVVIDSVLKSDGDENLILKRNNAEKIKIGTDLTTFKNNRTYFEKNVGIWEINPRANLHVGANQVSGAGVGIVKADGSNPVRSYFAPGHGNVTHADGGWGLPSIFAVHSIITNSYFVAMEGTPTTSDDRIKSEEVDITKATETLMLLRPKNYYKHHTYRVPEEDESRIPEKDASGNVIKKTWESGVIAQDLIDIPELQHLLFLHIDPETDDDLLTINYTQFIPFLIKSIQELNARIITLEQKNNVD